MDDFIFPSSPELFAIGETVGEYIQARDILNSDRPFDFVEDHVEVAPMAPTQVLPDAQYLPTLVESIHPDCVDDIEFLRVEMSTPKATLKRERTLIIEEGATANAVGGPAQARGGNTRSASPPPPRASQDTDEPVQKKPKVVEKKSAGAGLPQGSPAKFWCFTAHPQQGKTAEEWGEMIFNGIKGRCKRVAMQIEKCPETDKRHIQGCLEGNSKLRWTEFKLDKSIHWEACKGTWSDNFSYCTKADTRDGRNWLKGCMVQEEIRVLREDQLTEWQSDLLAIMDTEADDRTVYWIWSNHGGVGKSSFAKFCAVTRPGVMVANGKATDILAQVVMYKDTTGAFPGIIIMNLPRCTEGHVSYTALEQMKDGLAMSSKYEGGQIIMNPAHVFVFANTPPDMTKMSEDRFKIICLDQNDD